MSLTSSENGGLFSAFSHQQCRIMKYLEEKKKRKGRRRKRTGEDRGDERN